MPAARRGVSATIGGGITANGAGATVVLRGLRLNGGGASGTGVRINNAAAVHIVDCEVQNFAGAGIANTGADTTLFVSSSVVRNNSFDGLFFSAGGSGALAVDNSRFERNGVNSSYSGLKSAGQARISRSIATLNFGDGIRVSGGSVNINWTTAAHNGGSGYLVSASGFMTVE